MSGGGRVPPARSSEHDRIRAPYSPAARPGKGKVATVACGFLAVSDIMIALATWLVWAAIIAVAALVVLYATAYVVLLILGPLVAMLVAALEAWHRARQRKRDLPTR